MSKNCTICPRVCGVDRSKRVGYCGVGEKVVVKYVMLHHYEEPIISGDSENGVGSGAIFFGGCNLRCEYCQNYNLSHYAQGAEITVEQLVQIFKSLENMGAYNINLVTPTHFTEQIIDALKIYKPNIPIVWNTSGYERPQTIESLKGYVDIFLTDFKYFSNSAGRLSNAENYSYYATHSILKYREIVGLDIIENGLMKKGMIVRHLVLPNHSDDSVKILEWIEKYLGKSTIVSILNQYVPMYKACFNPLINRKVSKLEYKRVVSKAIELGLDNSYIQEDTSASDVFTPNFDDDNNLLYKILKISGK